MDNSSEEYFTPKVDGRGDGFKPSFKKKPNVVVTRLNFRNYDKKQKTLEPKSKLNKSNSVAEITPTKSSRNMAHARKVEVKDVSLIATPRPFPEKPLAPRRCPRTAATCSLFSRTILFAWRRTRTTLQEREQLCEMLKEQRRQLELQIDVLRNLSNTECSRRQEAALEVQQLKILLDQERLKQTQLKKDLDHAQTQLEETMTSLKLGKESLKRNEEQSARLHERIKKIIKEKKEMSSKLAQQEHEISDQKALINELEKELKIQATNLQSYEVAVDAKRNLVDELLKNLNSETNLSTSLRVEVEELRLQKAELEERSKLLEEDLESSVRFCDCLREEAACLSEVLETTIIELDDAKKWNWRDKTRDFLSDSLSTAHRVALVVLPVLFENRVV